jgi:hypothetical protein
VSAVRHDAGNISLMTKWSLPNSGALLSQAMAWETQVRMPKPLPGVWFAFWITGDAGVRHRNERRRVVWLPNIDFDADHSDSVGGKNMIECRPGLSGAGYAADGCRGGA